MPAAPAFPTVHVKPMSPDETLTQAVEKCIDDNAGLVQRRLRNEPGSWGALAGKAVLSHRARLGRPLTEAERRALWSALWQRLSQVQRLRNELP